MGKRVKRDIKDNNSVSIRFEGQDEFIAFNVSEKDGISEVADVSLNDDKKLLDEKKDNVEIKEEHSSFAEQFINAVKKKKNIIDEDKIEQKNENKEEDSKKEESNDEKNIDKSIFIYSSENKGKRSVLLLFFTLAIIIPVGIFGFFLGQEYAKKHDEQLHSIKEDYMYEILNTGYTDEDIETFKNRHIRAFLQSIGVIMYDISTVDVSKYGVFNYNDEEFILNISNDTLEINNDNGTLFRYKYDSGNTIIPIIYNYNDYLVLYVKTDFNYSLQVLNQEFELLLDEKIIDEGIVTFSSTDIYYGTIFCPNKMFDVEPQISVYRFDTNKNVNEAFGVLKDIPDGACNY